MDAPAQDKPHGGNALAVGQVGPRALNDQMSRQEDGNASNSEQCHEDGRSHGVGYIAGERNAEGVERVRRHCAGTVDGVDYRVLHLVVNCDLRDGLREWC